tara:strand:- start:715 stop:2067 length:1353 start_codon:yes stop_codon:yes gene_type:complete
MSEVKTNKISSLESNNDITLDPDGTGDVIVAAGHKLGIGTTSPDTSIHISADASARFRVEDTTNNVKFDVLAQNSDVKIGTNSNHDLRVMTNNTEQVRITSGGLVGLDATSPVGRLQVGGSTVSSDNKLVFGKSVTTSESFFPVIQQASHDGAGSDLALGATSTSGKVRFFTGASNASATLGASSNAERMTITSSGLVGIGTDSPAVELDIAGSGEMLHLSSTDTNKASIVGKGSSANRWKLGTLDSNDSVTLQASNSTGELKFQTGGANERARISSSGRFSIGTTSTSFRFNVVSDQSDYVAQFDRNVNIDGSFRNHIVFRRGGTSVGEILTSQSATQYGTSSDHRLKENVENMTGAIDRVKQLSPKRFSWIVDDLDSPNFDGFLAHEAQSIVPQAASGSHNEVDGDGNPVMQAIDHSMLVPLLTGALKEAIAKIETLETKVAALEAGE